MVGRGVRRVPARLCRDDLQGAGEDPGPHLPLPHGALARGAELCGAHPAAGIGAGVRRPGNRARRIAPGLADGTLRGEIRLRRLGHARGGAAGPEGARAPGRAARGAASAAAGAGAGQGGGLLARAGGGGFPGGMLPMPVRAKAPSIQAARQTMAALAEPMEGWLIPPYFGPEGRDSLGRGLDPASVAAVVAKDRAVQQERAALVQYLRGAYRDPDAAKAQLDELVKSQGWTSTAARIAPDPAQLGPLRGKTGFFAGRQAKADRVAAERAAWAIAPALDRIAAAENRAAETYRSDVDAQRQADAVGVPKLGRRAEAAITALAAAPDDKARAAAWRGISEDQVVGGEVERFREAVRQRFGDDAVRAMMRSGAGPIEAASVRPEHRAALRAVSRTVHVLEEGEFRVSYR